MTIILFAKSNYLPPPPKKKRTNFNNSHDDNNTKKISESVYILEPKHKFYKSVKLRRKSYQNVPLQLFSHPWKNCEYLKS